MRLTGPMSSDEWQVGLLDLEDYLGRLGVPARNPSGPALAELHEAHVRTFTFDNIDVLLAGPMPTPAIAYLTRALRLSAGIVISASHNPYYDNGIKFFSSSGMKLPDDVELRIEAALGGALGDVELGGDLGAGGGTAGEGTLVAVGGDQGGGGRPLLLVQCH